MEFDQTHWAPQRRRGPLPTFYYHEHFVEMLEFVRAHYAHVLEDRHVEMIRDFFALTREAQCLYVRLVNRKGRLFARGRLRYPELGDIKPLISELRNGEWIQRPGPEHFDDILKFLTRAEIYDVLLRKFAGIGRSMKKAELIQFAREHCEPDDFLSASGTSRLLVQGRMDEVRYVLFLYFGRIQDGLSQFTMRDLGLVRTQTFTENYEPRFGERREAFEHFFYATQLHELKSVAAEHLTSMVRQVHYWPDPEFAGSASIRDKLAFRLGRKLEQAGDKDAALTVYKSGESTRCSERVMRLMLAGDDIGEAENYLERCLENPRSDEEWLVAKDIFERKFNKKKTSALTDLLRDAEIIDIDESKIGSPEAAAAEFFEKSGATAPTEPRTCYGERCSACCSGKNCSAQTLASLHSPFEFLPSSLADGTFRDRHAEAIADRLKMLGDPAQTKRQLLKVSTAHYGAPNGVFRWRQSCH